MRGISSFVLVLLLFISCSKEEKDKIPFWHVMGGPLGDVLDDIINRFNSESEGSSILSVKMGNYATLSQKIMGAVASGKPPVFSQVYESWTSELLKADKIVPVERYLSYIPDSVLRDIFPVFIEDNTWDGELVSFPFNKSVPVFYYNRDIFDRYDIAEFPRTWDEFRTVAKRLTIDEDGDGNPEIYGTAFPVQVWMFETLLIQNGGKLIENGEAVFDGPEGIEALQYLIDLLYVDSSSYLTTGYRHQDDFAMGKVAMVWGTIVSYSFLKDKIKFSLGVAPIPRGDDSTVVISGTNVAIFKNTDEERRKRAMEFIKFFLEPDIQAQWSRGTGYLPLRKNVLSHPYMMEFFKEVPGMKEAMLQVNYAIFEPRTPAWFAGRRYLATEGIEPALRRVLTPEEALERAKRFLDLELKRTGM